MIKNILLLLAVTLLFGIIGWISMRGSLLDVFSFPAMVLFAGLFGWILPVALKRVNAKIWVFSGFILLVGLLFPTSLIMSSNYQFGPFSTLVSTIIILLPSLALINATLLLFPGLNRRSSGMENDKMTVFSFVLGALLMIKTLHNLYDLTIWDNTYDPLGYLWLFFPILIVVACGFTLAIALPGGMKLTGTAYSILTPILLIAVSALAQSVDFREETAKRAERTVRAIESYYAREGSYPKTLSQLSPWHAVSLPKPMVIYGQDWCYESGGDYYRLGYVDREHWSDPRLIGRIYRSIGEVPDSQPMCNDEVNALQSHFPGYQYSYWKESK